MTQTTVGVIAMRVVREGVLRIRHRRETGMTPIYVGQQLLVEMEFRLLGAPTDPTTVRLIVRAPSGIQSEVLAEAMVHRDVGLYEAAVLVDAPGTWVFRGEGEGAVAAVHEHTVHVEPSAISVEA
jgi:hypothetical protein